MYKNVDLRINKVTPTTNISPVDINKKDQSKQFSTLLALSRKTANNKVLMSYHTLGHVDLKKNGKTLQSDNQTLLKPLRNMDSTRFSDKAEDQNNDYSDLCVTPRYDVDGGSNQKKLFDNVFIDEDSNLIDIDPGFEGVNSSSTRVKGSKSKKKGLLFDLGVNTSAKTAKLGPYTTQSTLTNEPSSQVDFNQPQPDLNYLKQTNKTRNAKDRRPTHNNLQDYNTYSKNLQTSGILDNSTDNNVNKNSKKGKKTAITLYHNADIANKGKFSNLLLGKTDNDILNATEVISDSILSGIGVVGVKTPNQSSVVYTDEPIYHSQSVDEYKYPSQVHKTSRKPKISQNLSLYTNKNVNSKKNHKLLSFLSTNEKPKKKMHCSAFIEDLMLGALDQSSIAFKKINVCNKLSITGRRVVVLEVVDKDDISKVLPDSFTDTHSANYNLPVGRPQSREETFKPALTDTVERDCSKQVHDRPAEPMNEVSQNINIDTKALLSSNVISFDPKAIDLALITDCLNQGHNDGNQRWNKPCSNNTLNTSPLDTASTDDPPGELNTPDFKPSYIFDNLFTNVNATVNNENLKRLQYLVDLTFAERGTKANYDHTLKNMLSTPLENNLTISNALNELYSNEPISFLTAMKGVPNDTVLTLYDNITVTDPNVHYNSYSDRSSYDHMNSRNVKANGSFAKFKGLGDQSSMGQYEHIDDSIKTLQNLPLYSNETSHLSERPNQWDYIAADRDGFIVYRR